MYPGSIKTQYIAAVQDIIDLTDLFPRIHGHLVTCKLFPRLSSLLDRKKSCWLDLNIAGLSYVFTIMTCIICIVDSV